MPSLGNTPALNFLGSVQLHWRQRARQQLLPRLRLRLAAAIVIPASQDNTTSPSPTSGGCLLVCDKVLAFGLALTEICLG